MLVLHTWTCTVPFWLPQAEIRSLWHVQHQEKEERRRLLLQQREVGKLRLSAQNYWEKARQLEEDEGNVSVSVSSVSSVSQISGRLESPVQTNVTVSDSEGAGVRV